MGKGTRLPTLGKWVRLLDRIYNSKDVELGSSGSHF